MKSFRDSKHKLIVRIACSILLLVQTYFIGAHAAPVSAIEPGQSARGIGLDLKRYSGKIVYLDFWASWCPSCRQSIPWLGELQKKYGSERFQVLAVNVDTDPEAAKRFISEGKALDFPIVFDPKGKLPEAFNIVAMPSSYLLDKDGKVISAYEGMLEADKVELESKIQGLIGNQP